MRRPNDPHDFDDEEWADSQAREAEEEEATKRAPLTWRELDDIWKEVFENDKENQ